MGEIVRNSGVGVGGILFYHSQTLLYNEKLLMFYRSYSLNVPNNMFLQVPESSVFMKTC